MLHTTTLKRNLVLEIREGQKGKGQGSGLHGNPLILRRSRVLPPLKGKRHGLQELAPSTSSSHLVFILHWGIESFTQTYYTPWGIEFSIISVGFQYLNPSVTFFVKVSPSVFEVSRISPFEVSIPQKESGLPNPLILQECYSSDYIFRILHTLL